ncbi:glycosyltransferase family 4 protein [Vibrio tarriae]|uniref:glycosyltransferase family 4 protein n=1 Tax=Vibrio tarriae TaxID=2014742 RepID=UPI000DE27BDB|nr:glycosyltransferase family 4 protein [Vibrio tarriae]RBM33172.1 hypothetical protein DLR62_19500 [Vibrio tarriae]
MRKLIIVTGHSTLDSGGVGTHVRVLTEALKESGVEYELVLGLGLKVKIYNEINKIIDVIFKAKGVFHSTQLIPSISFFEDKIESVIKKTGIKERYLIHCHDRQSMIAAIKLKNKYDIKVLQTIHAPFRQQYEDNLNTSKTLIPSYVGALDRAFLKSCDGFIAVDELQQDILINDYPDLVNKSMINIVHNAVEKMILSDAITTKSNYHVVARHLHKKNGVEYAIKAFSLFNKSNHFDRSKLLILGDGGEKQKLQMLAKELDIENDVIFKGAVPRKDCLKYIKNAKSSIVPSIPVGMYIEATSLTMLESLALKTPLIASNIGGIKEVLNGKESAFLVEPGDVDAIYRSFVEINFGNISEMVENGFNLIAEGYTSQSWLNKHITIYKKF